jgi:hypothetical protein
MAIAARVGTILALIALVVLVLFRPAPLASCGPFFEHAVFTFSENLSLDDAARGRWDVVQPEFRHVSLIVAYRYLTGAGLAADERDSIAPRTGVLSPQDARDAWPPGVASWLRARGKVPGAAPVRDVQVFRQFGQYQYFHNCLEDAFANASRTLDDRLRQFGPANAAVAEWLRGQDAVFRNCGGGSEVPPAVPADAPAIIRADREYQIAAARFYATDFQSAESMFRTIAADPRSPWEEIAPYLVVRAMLRRATLVDGPPDMALLARAESELRRLADDPRHGAQDSVRGLLSFVELRLHHDRKLAELSRSVTTRNAGSRLAREVTDFHYLFDRLPASPRPKQLEDLPEWLRVFQARDRESQDLAVARWKSMRTLPWLVASLTKVAPDDGVVAELLGAAGGIPDDSPAYVTAAFHCQRLLAGSGHADEARRRLDALVSAKPPRYSDSAKNLLRAQRMKLARSLREFLIDAPRTPVGAESVGIGGEGLAAPGVAKLQFDADAAAVLNERLPLAMLAEAGGSGALPALLRTDVVQAAWTRAVLLDDQRTGAALANILSPLAPGLRQDLAAYRNARGPDARRFAAVLGILRNPGLRPYVTPGYTRSVGRAEIDNLRDNWWCGFGVKAEEAGYIFNHYRIHSELSPPLRMLYPSGSVDSPAFLSGDAKMQAEAEWKRLASLPAAPTHLAREVMRWALTHREDPRVPEALHLAVRATRYGCTDAGASGSSRQAFDLLHRRYPKSEWARKTKYWF